MTGGVAIMVSLEISPQIASFPPKIFYTN